MADASDLPDLPDLSGDTGRPDPGSANTPAEFVETMRRLKRWSGLGFRQLEKHATASGQALPRSTLTAALSRDSLPREDLVEAFAYACGCAEDQVGQWVAARRRIAGSGVTLVPDEPLVVVRPPVKRRTRWPVRTTIVLLAMGTVAAVAVYLVVATRPPQNPGQAAPPSASQAPPVTSSLPEASTPIAPPNSSATTITSPSTPPVLSQSTPANSPVAKTTTKPLIAIAIHAPTNPSLPPTRVETPRVPVDTGKDTIQLPGEPAIHCPTPYLGTMYGPVAQCTQQSGDQARQGMYSPFTREFGPSTDWMKVVDKTWFDRSVLATDGVNAWARGYAAVETTYGPGVWATQYRDGEARWGLVNLITNRFYPASTGWQPAKR